MEKTKETKAAYRAANKDKILEYLAKNKEKIKERKRSYVDAHADKIRETRAEYRKKNASIINAKKAITEKANPEQSRTRSRNRRARVNGADGFHTSEDVARIRKLQNGLCAVCRIKLKGRGHIDHIQPLAKGGSNWPRNLQLLCGMCNIQKGVTDPIIFMQRKGMLL